MIEAAYFLAKYGTPVLTVRFGSQAAIYMFSGRPAGFGGDADVGGSIYCSSSGTGCFFRVSDFFVVQSSMCSTVLPVISVSTVDFLIQPRRDTLTVSVLRAFLAMRYFASALAVRPSAWFAFSGRQIADVCFGSAAAPRNPSSSAAAFGGKADLKNAGNTRI